MASQKRYCVFGCAHLGAYMHSFPHPDRRPEMFEKWLSIVGEKLKETDPLKIYKNKKICNYHFTSDQKVASHRLMMSAVPCQFLDGIFESPAVSIKLEHNYCTPGVSQAIEPGPHHAATSTNLLDIGSTNRGTTTSGAQQAYLLNESSGSGSSTMRPSINKEKSSEHILKKFKTAQKELKKIKNTLRKTKKRELSYKSRIAEAEKVLTNKRAFDIVTKNMTIPGRIFTGMQFRHALKRPRGRRYTTEEKILALSIYKKSRKCYGMLSKYFKLPSAKALKILLAEIKIKPGINKIIFEKIKETAGELSEEDCLCTLMFDEMSLESKVHFNASRDEFRGFVSQEDQLSIANHVLVFMIKGIKKNFKQPVAYYFTQSLKKTQLKNIIKDVVRHVHSTGLKIICTVCDQGATNVSAINSLVADTREKYLRAGKEWRHDHFSVDQKKIIPIYDVPHLMKGLRNNLLTKDLKYIDHDDGKKEKIVKWRYFEMLYKADKSRGELSYLHKLTDEHIYKDKIKKMRVKMATQLFSKSVAVTTDHLTFRKELPEECRQLIPIVILLDKVFDSLNAGTFHIPNGKVFRAGVKKDSPHHTLWQEALKYFKDIKYIVKERVGDKIRLVERKIPTVCNFIKTIEGMREIWSILNKKYSLDCMLTRNFNQDPVENFFGNIRSLGGRNVKPDCQAFEGAYKTLLLNNYACKQAVNANCEEDFSSCLQTLEFLIKKNKNNKGQTHNTESIEISEKMFEVLSNVRTGGSSSEPLKRYVCGWVLKKCLTKIVKGCEICKNNILGKETENENNAYIKSKEYNAKKYWLIYPSNEVAQAFSEIQDITSTFLKTNFKKNKPKENIKLLVNSFATFPFNCNIHKVNLQKEFVDSTINLLLYSWCRTINKILSGKKQNEDLDDPLKQQAQLYYNTHKKKSFE